MKQRVAVYRGLGGYGTLGLEIVLSILVGMFAGNWADGRFGTTPWLMWAGFALGGAAAVRAIQRALRSMRRETEREEREQGNPAPTFESESDRAMRRREAAIQAEIQALEAGEDLGPASEPTDDSVSTDEGGGEPASTDEGGGEPASTDEGEGPPGRAGSKRRAAAR